LIGLNTEFTGTHNARKEYESLSTTRRKHLPNVAVETCTRCGGTVKGIACIEDPALIKKILTHLQEKSIPDTTALCHRAVRRLKQTGDVSAQPLQISSLVRRCCDTGMERTVATGMCGSPRKRSLSLILRYIPPTSVAVY